MDKVRITSTISVPLREIRFRFSRSSGPGGQNVNKRDTQVELVFDVATAPSLGPRQRARVLERLAGKLDSRGRLHIVSSTARTQGGNREIAIERFQEVLARAVSPPPAARRRTRPSASALRRRREQKTRRSRLKRQRTWKEED